MQEFCNEWRLNKKGAVMVFSKEADTDTCGMIKTFHYLDIELVHGIVM